MKILNRNHITIVERRETWWFHTIRKLNFFFYKFWWLFLLLFMGFLVLWYFFCFKKIKKNEDCVKIDNIFNSIDKIDSTLNNCCNCNPVISKQNPCNTAETMNGGKGFYEKKHNLGNSPGTVRITYDMYRIADKMDVYFNGNLVATTKNLVSGQGMLEWKYFAKANEPDFCTIVLTAPNNGTSWKYFIACPE